MLLNNKSGKESIDEDWIQDNGEGFFICLKDGFTTNSHRGMNIHRARIHPRIEDLFK